MIKELKIAIVEDSKPYIRLLSMFLNHLSNKVKISIELEVFDNPIDYKVNKREFDIVILDYVFRQYTYGANGFYLAKFTKEQFPNTFVILNSSYGKSEIGELLNEFAEYIDAYTHKESEMNEKSGLLYVIEKRFVDKR